MIKLIASLNKSKIFKISRLEKKLIRPIYGNNFWSFVITNSFLHLKNKNAKNIYLSNISHFKYITKLLGNGFTITTDDEESLSINYDYSIYYKILKNNELIPDSMCKCDTSQFIFESLIG